MSAHCPLAQWSRRRARPGITGMRSAQRRARAGKQAVQSMSWRDKPGSTARPPRRKASARAPRQILAAALPSTAAPTVVLCAARALTCGSNYCTAGRIVCNLLGTTRTIDGANGSGGVDARAMNRQGPRGG